MALIRFLPRSVLLASALLVAVNGCGPKAIETPSKIAAPPTEPGTFQKMPDLSK